MALTGLKNQGFGVSRSILLSEDSKEKLFCFACAFSSLLRVCERG